MKHSGFVRKIEREFGCRARNYYVLYNGKDATVECDPQEVFQDLKLKSMEMGKQGNARRWERIRESAVAQSWESVKIQYCNVEKFL